MIPKIIHYCWFGGKEMPELMQKCIASWKQHLPDYELHLWNEQNFDLDRFPYAREAYDNKKYAFVSDVARLWALKEYGGIYLDTDVEVLRPLDDFLHLPAFMGYEDGKLLNPAMGIIGSVSQGVWVTDMLAYYNQDRHFVKPDGSLDITTIPIIITRLMQAEGFVCDGTYRVYKGDMHVFPVDYFYPLSSTRVLRCTKNTYCIHHFAGSWREESRSERMKDWICEHILGRQLTDHIVKLKRKLKKRK